MSTDGRTPKEFHGLRKSKLEALYTMYRIYCTICTIHAELYYYIYYLIIWICCALHAVPTHIIIVYDRDRFCSATCIWVHIARLSCTLQGSRSVPGGLCSGDAIEKGR